MKPTLAIVGRPNVGKSTLFNRLTRTRDALVADVPGLTRDRHYGVGRLGDRPYLAVDTGGLEPEATGVFVEMARQVRTAIAEADIIVLVTDAREGLTAPLALGREVAVGDVEGYVHFLSRENGAFLGRVATDGSPIRSLLVRLDRGFLVQTQDGNLFALSTE